VKQSYLHVKLWSTRNLALLTRMLLLFETKVTWHYNDVDRMPNLLLYFYAEVINKEYKWFSFYQNFRQCIEENVTNGIISRNKLISKDRAVKRKWCCWIPRLLRTEISKKLTKFDHWIKILFVSHQLYCINYTQVVLR